ncbi:PepSY domain-containing protein [Litorisediminicola beolgyonensis]|uniref:PepSY domain-containing protein n=1 Tax=Litorisediminicola beolgyonensis TaxID=1173614 RepID=A0ABW3ZMT0_9RHOB
MTLRSLTAATLLAAIAATGAMASEGTVSPEQDSAIREKLTDEGYEVRKIEIEDGMIEVYALKDGGMFELYLDDQLEIVKTKEE